MSEADQCRALTESGDRCSRPARADGFCYQHCPDDETIDETGETEENDMSEETATERSESDETGSDETESDETESDETEGEIEATADGFDVMDVRETIENVASDLVGRPLDGIIEITEDDEGWEVVVEMVERSAIPDTQDILGQYAVSLNESGGVTGYRLRERYRRGDEQER